MSELYTLPDGWEWKKLGDLTTTTSGGTPKRNEKLYWGGNIGWLKSGELNDGYITSVEEYITKEGLTKSSAKLFPKGTLLIAMYGATVGKLGILEIETTTNQAICGILNDKNKFETFFMFYYFRKIREKMIEDSFGGAQPNLSQTYIKDLDIPLPPLEEQKRIVAKLDNLFVKIDKAIALHQKNIDEANVFMASVLNDVFVELEENFQIKTLKDISNIISGYAFKSGDFSNNNEIKSIKITNVGVQNFVEEDDNLLSQELLTKFSKYTANYGDIAIALTRPYISNGLKVTYIPKTYDGAFINQRVAVIQSNEKFTSNNFIYHYLCTSNVLSNVMELSKTLNQPNLSIKDLSNFEIPLPPLPTQQKVVSYLDEISKKMEKIKQIQKEKMQSLKALKASILDQAFRGEL